MKWYQWLIVIFILIPIALILWGKDKVNRRVEKILSKIRFWIALYLNDRHPEMCWAQLVMWSLGYHTFKETFTEEGCKSQSCRGKNPWDAYCGKCACTGRLYRQEAPEG